MLFATVGFKEPLIYCPENPDSDAFLTTNPRRVYTTGVRFGLSG